RQLAAGDAPRVPAAARPRLSRPVPRDRCTLGRIPEHDRRAGAVDVGQDDAARAPSDEAPVEKPILALRAVLDDDARDAGVTPHRVDEAPAPPVGADAPGGAAGDGRVDAARAARRIDHDAHTVP